MDVARAAGHLVRFSYLLRLKWSVANPFRRRLRRRRMRMRRSALFSRRLLRTPLRPTFAQRNFPAFLSGRESGLWTVVCGLFLVSFCVLRNISPSPHGSFVTFKLWMLLSSETGFSLKSLRFSIDSWTYSFSMTILTSDWHCAEDPISVIVWIACSFQSLATPASQLVKRVAAAVIVFYQAPLPILLDAARPFKGIGSGGGAMQVFAAENGNCPSLQTQNTFSAK